MASELAKLLGERFIQRKDVKAWQFPGGGYAPDRSPITFGDLRAHLDCRKTMGHYLLDADDKCRIFAFDIDLAKKMQFDEDTEIHPREEFLNPHSVHREFLIGDLTHMAEGIARRTHRLFDLPVAISFSGSKGVHVTAFCGEVPADKARTAAREVLESFGCFTPTRGDNFFVHDSEWTSLELELFPKQSSLDGKDGLGNLLRLPLGVHRKTKQRSFFLQVGPSPRGSFHEMDPIEALSGRLPWE